MSSALYIFLQKTAFPWGSLHEKPPQVFKKPAGVIVCLEAGHWGLPVFRGFKL